jgi:hypothetical protein
MLDPDPYQMITDPKHCCRLRLVRTGTLFRIWVGTLKMDLNGSNLKLEALLIRNPGFFTINDFLPLCGSCIYV